MGRAQKSCLRQERGATMVESAFVFVLLLTLLFGMMGFAHALYAYHFVNNAAKEAVRWASVNGATCGADSSCNGVAPMNNGPATATDVSNYVQTLVPSGIDGSKVSVTACGVARGSACAASSPDICTTAVGSLPATPNYPGCSVQVQVGYAFNMIFPLLPVSTSVTAPCTQAGICLSSTADMVIAH
jgi:Flp pilus assembly protein TadG